jgi:hypothetical protein
MQNASRIISDVGSPAAEVLPFPKQLSPARRLVLATQRMDASAADIRADAGRLAGAVADLAEVCQTLREDSARLDRVAMQMTAAQQRAREIREEADRISAWIEAGDIEACLRYRAERDRP